MSYEIRVAHVAPLATGHLAELRDHLEAAVLLRIQRPKRRSRPPRCSCFRMEVSRRKRRGGEIFTRVRDFWSCQIRCPLAVSKSKRSAFAVPKHSSIESPCLDCRPAPHIVFAVWISAQMAMSRLTPLKRPVPDMLPITARHQRGLLCQWPLPATPHALFSLPAVAATGLPSAAANNS